MGERREPVEGDRVRKSEGDYVFEGEVVARFNKRSSGFAPGAVRFVVEDDRGLLLIMSAKQIEVIG